MNHRALRRSTALMVGSSLALIPAVPALADTAPAPKSVDIDNPQPDQTPPVALSNPATRSVDGCWQLPSRYDYSTSIFGATITAFSHSPTTGLCRSGNVISKIYEVKNDCTKSAWVVTFTTHKAYRFGPSQTPGTKTAFATAECAVDMNISAYGVGVHYSKQSNVEHDFTTQENSTTYSIKQWTTNP